MNEIFFSTYIFIFPKKYDIYYTIYLVLLNLHWILLKNECIISYIEKKIIDKNYVLGSDPYYHPYKSIIKNYYYIIDIIKIINIIVVFNRNIKNKYIFICMLFIIGTIFINFYKKNLSVNNHLS